MTKITLEINSCQNCPFWEAKNENGTFENGFKFTVFDWYCNKSNKTIHEAVEFFEVNKIEKLC